MSGKRLREGKRMRCVLIASVDLSTDSSSVDEATIGDVEAI
jgi:hypothetical protein